MLVIAVRPSSNATAVIKGLFSSKTGSNNLFGMTAFVPRVRVTPSVELPALKKM